MLLLDKEITRNFAEILMKGLINTWIQAINYLAKDEFKSEGGYKNDTYWRIFCCIRW